MYECIKEILECYHNTAYYAIMLHNSMLHNLKLVRGRPHHAHRTIWPNKYLFPRAVQS